MQVLVTGGTGYLGRAIVRALVARGHRPVIFARGASGSGLAGMLADGDVRDESALRSAARGCDAVCHSAALVSIWRPRRRDFDEVNVGGLANAVAAARQLGVPRFLYTSTFLALPPSDGGVERGWNDYQRTKLAADKLATRLVEEGAPIIRVYPGVIYGPGIATEGNLVGRMLADHVAGRLPGLIGADRLWSFAYIDDVANGHVSALEKGRAAERYLLCGDNAPQIRPFEILHELTGQPLPRRIPAAIASALACAEELRARVIGPPPRLTRGTVKIFRHDWAYDSELAVRELDFHITPLPEGVRRTIASLTP